MPRPSGVRNRDFAEKRADLVRRLTDFALSSDLRRPALRQFAQAVEVSEPTLRHYFTDRDGVIHAILEEIGARGAALWDTVAEPAGDLSTAVAEYFRISEAGMRHGGFVRAHAFGIIEGLGDTELGKTYIRLVLSPAINSLADMLMATPGKVNEPGLARAAAFSLFTPLVGIALHQDLLGGAEIDPIDVSSMLRMIHDVVLEGLDNTDSNGADATVGTSSQAHHSAK